MANYDLSGIRWNTGALVTRVTWSVDGTIAASWIPQISAAFSDWSQYANISFQQVASTGNITFTETFIDGAYGTLGDAGGYHDGRGSYISQSIRIDSAEDYHLVGGVVRSTILGPLSGSFDALLRHEIGHALGLDHLDAGIARAIMNPYLDTSRVVDLTKSDIDGIQAIYGARAGAPVATETTGLPGGKVASVSPVVPPMAPQVTRMAADEVFRFYDTRTGDHFYTTSPHEKANILATIPHYNYEGVAWHVPEETSNTVDVFRFYDTATETHFLTTSEGERDQIIRTIPTYRYEGVAFQAFASSNVPGGLTLDRFYNTEVGMHHYAGSAEESRSIQHGSAGPGWRLEGPSFTVIDPNSDLFFI